MKAGIDLGHRPEIGRLQQRCLMAGVLGGVLLGMGAFLQPDQFFRAYLMAFLFWLGVSIGCLAILMLQYLSGGGWGIIIRRLLEAATRVFPLMALLFIPLLFGLHRLYPWTHADLVNASEVLKHKQFYLNVPFFIGRAVFYFAVWLVLSYLLNSWSSRQDETADIGITRKLQVLSGPGIVLYGLTVSFAAIDWIMSLEPEWYSTIYGFLVMAGQALSAMAVIIAVLAMLAKQEPLASVVQAKHFQDLGKLMLTFVMLWAYMGFSQLLIIWSGDLPDEIPWYLRRFQGGWQKVGILLVVFQFALPFALLLSRNLKRYSRTLVLVAGLVFIMRFVDLFWMTAPSFSVEGGKTHVSVSWMNIVAPVAIGGLWLAAFFWQLKKRPILPLHEPYWEEEFATHTA
jgi:hypothetical protein